MRDAFFGVRRFGDFAAHLGVPRAVLAERLETLREAGVLAEARGNHGYREYVLTDKGLSLWPVVRDLLSWGDEYYSVNGPRRVFQHAQDAGAIGPDGACAACGRVVPPSDLLVLPGPGYDGEGDDLVSKSLVAAHRLLEPIRGR
jgi:DNA-binding HxlR family transcriptional regulator